MTHPARSWRIPSSALLPVATVALAAGTFIANLMTPVIPVGVLYVAVVLLTARFCSARGIMMAGAGCATGSAAVCGRSCCTASSIVSAAPA